MKKLILACALCVISVSAAKAQKINYLDEVKYLGAIAGQGLACETAKYDTYELLARAILISKAQSDNQQAEGMKVYNEEKAFNFIEIAEHNFRDCPEVNQNFSKQKIFKTTLYGDGTIKMFDGKIITPRHPYDATLVYKKDPDARKKYLQLYRENKQKTLNDPAFQKALLEQKRKYGF